MSNSLKHGGRRTMRLAVSQSFLDALVQLVDPEHQLVVPIL